MAGGYEEFIRTRITELRLKKNVSEHRMSLDLDKSGSYIRSITSGAAMPSLKELFKIMNYFDMTPAVFFEPLECVDTPYERLRQRLWKLDDADLEKVETFIDWITEKRG